MRVRTRGIIAVACSICLHASLGLAWYSLPRSAGNWGDEVRTEVEPPSDGEFTMQLHEPTRPRVVPQPKITPPRVSEEPGPLPSLPEMPSVGPATVIPANHVAPRQAVSKSLHAPFKAGKVVVYVLDRSSSMGGDGMVQAAKAAIRDSLDELPADVRFQLVAYNGTSSRFAEEPVAATVANVQRGRRWLDQLAAEGRSDHVAGWREGMRCRPDALYLLTDADDLELRDVRTLRAAHKHSIAINVVLFSDPTRRDKSPLAMWMNEIGGSIRYAK